MASHVARPLFHFLRAHAALMAEDESAIRDSLALLPRLWPTSARAWHLQGVLTQGMAFDGLDTTNVIAQVIVPRAGRGRSDEHRNLLALAAYRKALDLDPTYLPSRINLSVLLHDTGESEQALHEARRVTETAPTLAAAWLNLGAILESLGRGPEAIDAYRHGLSLDAEHAPLWQRLALALRGVGELAAAHDAAVRARDIAPALGITHVTLGLVLMANGETDAAIEAYRDAVAAEPDDAKGWINLGHALSRKGDTDGALAAAREAVTRDGRDLIARNNLAVALERSGRFEEALAHFRVGNELTGGRDASFLRGLGRCQLETDDVEEAVETLTRARDLLERNPNAKERLLLAVRRFLRIAREELGEDG